MSEGANGGLKARYEEAVQGMSDQARAAEKLEQRLRAAISRLAVLGLGGDREMDRRLENLRQAIHGEADTEEVLALVDAISARVRLLADLATDSPDASRDDEPLRALLLNLLTLLRRVRPEDARITGLIARVQRAGASDLAALSMAVENLVTQTVVPEQEGGRRRRPRLFGRRKAGTGQGQDAFELLLDRLQSQWPRATLSHLSKRLKREGSSALIPVAMELAEIVEQETRAASQEKAEKDRAADRSNRALPGSKPLKQLVTALRLPDEFSDAAEALTRQADEAFTEPARLGGWLTELAGLIRHFRTQIEQERKGLRTFLEKTLSRLAELDGHMDAEDEDRRQAAQKTHSLDRHLDGSLTELRRSVNGSRDMADLQQQITRHLEALGKGLKLRRRLDDERERAMERRFNEMRDRVSELERESDQLRDSLRRETRRSVLDPLTRLPNRQAFQERVGYERARQRRRDQPLSLMVCGLDEIELINERLGPEAGDVAIADFADKLSESIRPGDFVARLEGVEFVVILPDAGADAAIEQAERVGELMATGNFVYEDVPFSLSAIFGIAEFTDEEVPDQVLRRARQALRNAREAGEACLLAQGPGNGEAVSQPRA